MMVQYKPSRRSFLKLLGFGALTIESVRAKTAAQARREGIANFYSGLRSDQYFDGEFKVEVRVPDPVSFTEGPTVDSNGDVFFTNIPPSRIYRWVPSEQRLSVFRENSGKANGLLIDGKGGLLVCEQERRRVTRIDLNSGEVNILADQHEGNALEAPNDLILARDGTIFFTSRPVNDVPSGGYVNAVYRIGVDGSLSQILKEPEVAMPNGLAFSPDERNLYLVEAHPDEDRPRQLRLYDVTRQKDLVHPRTLVDFYPGRSGDGMCVDASGNLYVAAGLHNPRGTSETLTTRPGVHVFSSKGTLLAFAETPVDTVTNCTLGGPDLQTLYVTCGPFLLSIRTKYPGLSS